MNLRTVLSVLGVALALTGFALVAVPGLASSISLDDAVLVVVGLLAVVQGLRVAGSRRTSPYEQVETDDPEDSQDLPTPGDEFDELLAQAGTDRRAVESKENVRDRLERAAISTIVRTQGCSRAEAERLVDEGEWTDDPYAAAFFTGRVEGASMLSRIDFRSNTQSQYQRWAVHAASEVSRMSEAFDG